jgi:hypothetical protein
MDSEAALAGGFLFARFSSKRTWCCCRVAALSVKFTSFCGQAEKKGGGGLIDMTYILSLGDDGSACRLKANILVRRVRFLCMSVLTRGRHGGVS